MTHPAHASAVARAEARRRHATGRETLQAVQDDKRADHGASRVEQIEDAVGALQTAALSEDELAAIDVILAG